MSSDPNWAERLMRQGYKPNRIFVNAERGGKLQAGDWDKRDHDALVAKIKRDRLQVVETVTRHDDLHTEERDVTEQRDAMTSAERARRYRERKKADV